MLAFRTEDFEVGRMLYRKSLEMARAMQLEAGELAHVYLALEELRANTPRAPEVRKAAIEETQHITEPWCKVVIDRLKRFPKK
jgi:hypothetical protein